MLICLFQSPYCRVKEFRKYFESANEDYRELYREDPKDSLGTTLTEPMKKIIKNIG